MAGLEDTGTLIRLYPVPFRLIEDSAKFKKWQWITASIEKTKKDRRRESHRISVDTIICDDAVVSAKNGWAERRRLLAPVPIFERFADLDEARRIRGCTLGLLRPSRIAGLDITPTARDWTAEDRQKLLRMQQQGNLFDGAEASSIATLRKLPFDFHYRYICTSADGDEIEVRHKIVDWEVGALYWNVKRQHPYNWEAPFRKKIEQDIASSDLLFLMGTLHRFPDQWLIVSLIYPPKQQSAQPSQLSLL